MVTIVACCCDKVQKDPVILSNVRAGGCAPPPGFILAVVPKTEILIFGRRSF